MGRFDYTCAVSRLPIGDGVPVRHLLLTESPYRREPMRLSCTMTDWWFPRTFPIRGVYNDYGGSTSTDSKQHGLWQHGFTLDLINETSTHPWQTPLTRPAELSVVLDAMQDGRVRVAQSIEDPALARIRKQLNQARAHVRALGLEVLDEDAPPREPDESRPLFVTDTLIREDVWQALLATPVATRWDGTRTADMFMRAVRNAYADHAGKPEGSSYPSFRHLTDTGLAVQVTGLSVPFTVGLGTSWWHFIDTCAAWPAEEIEDFLQVAGEFAHILQVLSLLRFQWQAGTSTGPQDGAYLAHAIFQEKLFEIARRDVLTFEADEDDE